MECSCCSFCALSPAHSIRSPNLIFTAFSGWFQACIFMLRASVHKQISSSFRHTQSKYIYTPEPAVLQGSGPIFAFIYILQIMTMFIPIRDGTMITIKQFHTLLLSHCHRLFASKSAMLSTSMSLPTCSSSHAPSAHRVSSVSKYYHSIRNRVSK